MVIFDSRSVSVRTEKKIDSIDLTDEARNFVSKTRLKNGLLVVYEPHTTATLVINEMDPGLLRDMEQVMERLVPVRGEYEHNLRTGEGNAHAHIRNMLMNTFLVVPVADGRLVLGT